ncbi:MAG TPA: M14 family metallopeptidase [Sediminibacterium sp.]|jgi:hypothetical protein|uniref:M14 family metallopeptidase n=1 Tax=Sediminibacterium sp. TaxID=1917865 RepID=UPI0008CB3450|nr:M14 family metallopeptidase [Sediminibacterium sp.]OHC84340.1 MAG: hypothetical protein A2472_12855 [Sphingobacteriia bacterium RIFOXYC2_FULL_35_18]OHC88712.1 MAG: hypothetical protein A2546_02325 [Sphingobacteriia bacterium RIFOXYD2_FULL_35_12]OYY11822.1 MAG: hypothetical protein B7Y66_01490 [Sphingobacteriia bacterium 35-36-14]OYZ54725.1 MAG: hypothetical protein B7Y11_04345 [Sphingobacteriia bacterium 24-36-13]OZA65560.1 MAG: hypothetical protein B7X68_03470 [Sphingobacteriia bacterium 3
MKKLFLMACFLPLIGQIKAQQYPTLQEQQNRLTQLVKNNPKWASLQSLAKTIGGKDIWVMTLGSGKTETKPAIAVVGGVEGAHLLGTELVIQFAEKLLKQIDKDSVQKLLNENTYYLFPNMSPDAMETYFSKLPFERMGNANNTDDDRDGKTNEDAFDDLDGNGKITMMRIESPVGIYKLHPDDARVLIKADISKGEKGKFLLLSEGIDNDNDGQFNEDGVGGIHFNKNLTYKHKTFAAGAGEFPASEIETRAILDFLYDAFNVYAVVSFSSLNNLSANDDKVTTVVSELYNKTLGIKDAPKPSADGGDFMSWAYQHYGRFSFSTQGWWVPKAKPDTAKKEKAFTVEDATANYLRWSAQQGLNHFNEWKTVQHPDYPGQVVQVGGIDPFVMMNPPYKMVNEIAQKHTDFLTKLTYLKPQVVVQKVETKKLSNGLTKITIDVANTGMLPTHSKFADRNYFVKRLKVALQLTDKQQLIGGQKLTLINNMEPHTMQQFSWIVKGTGSITVETGSPAIGLTSKAISLQ